MKSSVFIARAAGEWMGRILNEMRRTCVKGVITIMTHFLVMALGLVLTGFRSIQNRFQDYLIGTQIIILISKIKMKVFENIFVPKILKPGEINKHINKNKTYFRGK